MNNDAVIQIGTILIALVGAVVTYVAIPYIKSKTTSQQYKNIEFWVKIAVEAAEQLFNQPGMGNEKKEYVVEFLEKMGIKITIEQLDVLVEAAVREINKNKG